MAHPGGRPKKPPTPEQIIEIGKWCLADLSMANACRHMGLHPNRIADWMEQGGNDVQDELDTPHAQFYQSCRKNQALNVSELLKRIDTCPKNWQALAWKLEKCLKEEFGSEAQEYKELVQLFMELKKQFETYKTFSLHHGTTASGDSPTS